MAWSMKIPFYRRRPLISDDQSVELSLLDPHSWDGVSQEAQREFLARGQEMIKETLALAHGADLRGTTMMGIFGAVGVALFAAGATIIEGTHPSWPLSAGAITASIGLFLASATCAFAARPSDFFISGFEPKRLLSSGARYDENRIRVLIAVTQDRIEYNRTSLEQSARLISAAMVIGGIGLAAGGSVFLVASLF
jgi:hypothetical protein